jgi:hypothetical protein
MFWLRTARACAGNCTPFDSVCFMANDRDK